MEKINPRLAAKYSEINGLDVDEPNKRRIRITLSCDDCEAIPKVDGAGQVFDGPDGKWQLMHNGVRVVAGGYCGLWTMELIRLLDGHHEPQEELVFHRLLAHVPPGSTILELGAWWSYYALWFLAAVPGASAHLVEPDPGFLEIGRRNFTLNGRTGHFHHYAIGQTSAKAVPFQCESNGKTAPVPVICVDDLLEKENIARVEILLCDIQGYEFAMLKGAERSIAAGKIRFAVISTHHHRISHDPLTHQSCMKFMKEHGAHFLAAHNVVESFSGDGLIAVSFDPADTAIPPIAISYNHPTNSLFRELEYDLHDAWEQLKARPALLSDERPGPVFQRLEKCSSQTSNHWKSRST